MIRPATLITMLLAAGSGLYLYQVKHQAQVLDEEIARVVHDTERARARTGELVAEYALLNDPSRLQDLAAAHLHLRPTEPTQFTTAAELGRRLPTIGAAHPTETEPLVQSVPMVAPLIVALAPAKADAAAAASVTRAKPAAAASAVAAGIVAAPRVRPRPTTAAQAAQSGPAAISAHPLDHPYEHPYDPGLFGAPVENATLPVQRPTAPRPPSLPPVLAAAHSQPRPPAYPAYYPSNPYLAPGLQSGGSSLGMARTLPGTAAAYGTR